MNDALYSKRKAIRSLRVGVVPSSHVLDLTVGIRTLKPILDHEIDRIGKTKANLLVIKGEWGTGKTNLLNYFREYALKNQIVVAHVNLDGRSAAANHPQRYYPKIIKDLRLPGTKGKGFSSLFNLVTESETLQQRTIKWATSNYYHSEIAKGFYWLFNGSTNSAIQILLGGDISFANYSYLKVKCIKRFADWGKYFKFIGFKGFMIQFDELETIVQLWNIMSRKGAYRVLYQISELKNILPIFATTERLDAQIGYDHVFGNLDDKYAREFVRLYNKNDTISPPGIEPHLVSQLLKRISKLYSEVYTLPKSFDLNSIKNRWAKIPFKNYRRLIRLTIDYFDRLRPISDRHYKEIVASRIGKNDFDDKKYLTHKEKHTPGYNESEWEKCSICSASVKKAHLKKHIRKVHENKKVYIPKNPYPHHKSDTIDKLGRYEEALKAYDKAIELKPDDFDTWSNKGTALGKLGRYEKALQAYGKALELNPDDSDTWNNIGITLRKLGRYEKALQAYEKALELKPDNSNAWNGKGAALDYLGRYEEALKAYDKALELKSDHSSAWRNKGTALGKLGRYEEAIRAIDIALEIKPDHSSAWYNKALALRKLGRYEEAEIAHKKYLDLI